MNEHRIAGAALLCRAAALTAALGLLAACKSPFSTDPSDLGPRVPTYKLRSIEPLDMQRFERPSEGAVVEALEPRIDPFAGMEELEMSLEQCRVWTLEYNLDLRVQLVEPTIANEVLSQEEARFEATFFIDGRYTSVDQPTETELVGTQVETLNTNLGVTIPLRSGGTVTLDLPASRSEDNNQFRILNPGYDLGARFSISQPLLRNAGRRTTTFGIRVAAINQKISEAQAKLEVIRRIAEVERAYWDLYAANRLLIVRQEQFELAQELLGSAQRRFDAGEVPEIEVIRAESGLADRLETIIVAENAVRQLQRRLKRIINVPGLTVDSAVVLAPVSEPDPVPFALDGTDLADRAMTQRMELLQLELELARDWSTIEFEKNQALPLFVLDYTYRRSGIDDSYGSAANQIFTDDFATWSVGGRFETFIGNEAAEARVHQAILRRLQRAATREAQEKLIRTEVLDAVDQIDATWQRILAARQATILAARRLAAEQNSFRIGGNIATDVLNAATDLADAQQSEILALTQYQVAQVDLAFATGTLLGAARVDWSPEDPRGPDDFVGEKNRHTIITDDKEF